MARLELGVDITVEGARELSRVGEALGESTDELRELSSHLDEAADAARRIADDIDRTAGGLDLSSQIDSADRLEQRATGFRDTITGLQDGVTAFTDSTLTLDQRLLYVGQSIGDLSSGFANFLLPALQAVASGALTTGVQMAASAARQVAAWAMLGAQSLLHAGKVALAWTIAMGPLGILIAAVVAAVALIIANWDKVSKFLGDVFRNIGKAMEALGKWIGEIWDGILDILGSAVKAVAGIGKRIWEPIGKGFASAIDFVKGVWNAFARWWNSIEISVPSIDIPFVGKVGGFAIGLPDLPMLADGGIVNSPTLALIGEKGPEAVVPLDRMPQAPVTIEVNVLGDLRAEDEESVARTISRVLWTQGMTDRVLTNG